MRHYGKAKDADGCRQTAESWETLNRTDTNDLHNAACFRAMTAAVLKSTPGPDAARLADDEADRAMAWLRKAVAAGYNDAEHIEQDHDLDVLRERADFQMLMTELTSRLTDEMNS